MGSAGSRYEKMPGTLIKASIAARFRSTGNAIEKSENQHVTRITQCNGVTPQNRTDTEQNRTESTPIGDPAAADDENPQHPGSATPISADLQIHRQFPANCCRRRCRSRPGRSPLTTAESRRFAEQRAAYSGAYPIATASSRYETLVNAAIKGFTRRIGADESPDVARY